MHHNCSVSSSSKTLFSHVDCSILEAHVIYQHHQFIVLEHLLQPELNRGAERLYVKHAKAADSLKS